jgi:hypothetical protein
MCQEKIGKMRAPWLLLVVGVLLVVGGIVVLLEPRALVWMMGFTSIVLGLMVTLMFVFLNRMRVHFQAKP